MILQDVWSLQQQPGGSAGFWVGGSAPMPPEAKKILKI